MRSKKRERESDLKKEKKQKQILLCTLKIEGAIILVFFRLNKDGIVLISTIKPFFKKTQKNYWSSPLKKREEYSRLCFTFAFNRIENGRRGPFRERLFLTTKNFQVGSTDIFSFSHFLIFQFLRFLWKLLKTYF